MDGSALGRELARGIIVMLVVAALLGGSCGAGCMWACGKAGGYRVKIEKVEK